jgi:glyoxylase-like metal-dependent hydrolase (beta-lactamase superfamily II)
VNVQELRPGLWRWTTPHPEWTPEEGGAEGWGPVVGSVYYEAAAELVLIDPLLPTEEKERRRFLDKVDLDVERHGKPVAILLTIYWHERSAEELARRYEGATVWAPELALRRMEIDVSNPFRVGDPLPHGVEAVESRRRGEVLYWLPGPRALVAGDVLLGTPEGGIRVCPDSWLKPDLPPQELRRSLRSLLDLPLELVLLAHGEPVLEGARDALERALTVG